MEEDDLFAWRNTRAKSMLLSHPFMGDTARREYEDCETEADRRRVVFESELTQARKDADFYADRAEELNDSEQEATDLAVALFEELEELRASQEASLPLPHEARGPSHQALLESQLARSQTQLAAVQAVTNLDLVCSILLEWAATAKRQAFSAFRSQHHRARLGEAQDESREANRQAEALTSELVENNALLVELSALEELRTSEVVARESEVGRLSIALKEHEARLTELGEASGDERTALLAVQLQEATAACWQLKKQLDEAEARATLFDKLQPLSYKSPSRPQPRSWAPSDIASTLAAVSAEDDEEGGMVTPPNPFS